MGKTERVARAMYEAQFNINGVLLMVVWTPWDELPDFHTPRTSRTHCKHFWREAAAAAIQELAR